MRQCPDPIALDDFIVKKRSEPACPIDKANFQLLDEHKAIHETDGPILMAVQYHCDGIE